MSRKKKQEKNVAEKAWNWLLGQPIARTKDENDNDDDDDDDDDEDDYEEPEPPPKKNAFAQRKNTSMQRRSPPLPSKSSRIKRRLLHNGFTGDNKDTGLPAGVYACYLKTNRWVQFLKRGTNGSAEGLRFTKTRRDVCVHASVTCELKFTGDKADENAFFPCGFRLAVFRDSAQPSIPLLLAGQEEKQIHQILCPKFVGTLAGNVGEQTYTWTLIAPIVEAHDTLTIAVYVNEEIVEKNESQEQVKDSDKEQVAGKEEERLQIIVSSWKLIAANAHIEE